MAKLILLIKLFKTTTYTRIMIFLAFDNNTDTSPTYVHMYKNILLNIKLNIKKCLIQYTNDSFLQI